MLVTVDHKIKSAIFTLQKLKGSGEHIVEMTDKFERHIDLIAGIPFSCKILLIEKKPPLLLNFKYLSGGGITVYGSY
jgi:hypothetical protein